MSPHRIIALGLGATLALSATAALAHALLDHAEPPVGRTVGQPPTAVHLWFTERLERFSRVQVFDAAKKEVDHGDSHVDAQDPTELVVSLAPLASGTYKVVWHVVSVDGHMTTGSHTFKIAGP